MGYTHNMTIIADSRRRVTLPKSAHPGDVFAVEMPVEGQFVLKRLERPSGKVKLTRKDGLLMASTGRKITMEQTRALMDELP